MKLFKNRVGRPSNETKQSRRIFVVSILAIAISIITLLICLMSKFDILTSNLKAETTNSKYNKTINAILETAKAYYRQGTQIQYDSYRKNLALTPEDATKQHINYIVCSGFTYGVYKNALGINLYDWTDELLKFAKKNKNNKNHVIFYGAGDYGNDGKSDDKAVVTNSGVAAFLNKRKKELKPGDLFVYKDNTGFGHVVLIESIVGDKINILEAIGENYNYKEGKDAYEKNGGIKRITLTQRLMQATKSAKVMQVAVIRVVTKENKCIANVYDDYSFKKDTCSITSSAKSRLKYKDIDIEKTVEKTRDSSGNIASSPIYVTEGGRITYVIKIKNNSDKDYDNLVVTESINTKLVEEGNFGSATLKDNKISWTVNVKAGKEKEIKYTVKVKSGTSGNIIKSTGKVANIPSSTVETLIEKKLSKSQANSVCTSFNELKSNDYVDRQYINEIYMKKLDVNLGLYNSTTKKTLRNKDILGKVNGNTPPVRFTNIKNANVKKYIYNNFYGLKIGNAEKNDIVSEDNQWLNKPNTEFNDRARTINKDMLFDGDIILIGDKESYVYCSGSLLRKNKKNSIIKKTGSNLNNFLSNMVGKDYIILRPYK